MGQNKAAGVRTVVFGAGGMAPEVIDALELAGRAPAAIYDDNEKLWGGEFMGYPVPGGRAALFAQPSAELAVVLAIARSDVKRAVAQDLEAHGIRLAGLRHPTAFVSPRATVAESALVMAGAIINPGARIGEHVVVNSNAVVSHECVIGPFAHIGPGASLCGKVHVGEGALIGTGASVMPFGKIGAWATVGLGSAVVSDVPDGCTALGVPARVIWRKE